MTRPGSTRYIVAPGYDWLFFISAPLWALLLGVLLAVSGLDEVTWGDREDAANVHLSLLGASIHAHLIIVVVRSHGHAWLRRQYPARFWLAPPLLLGALLISQWATVIVSVLATFWDVYHSGLQTFGLGRLYERRAGNALKRGRTLDLLLNHLLYAGPIVAGATMIDHFEDLQEFETLGVTLFSVVPVALTNWQGTLARWMIVGGTAFLGGYVAWAFLHSRQGHVIAWPKVALYVLTGACSIYTWGFNSFGEAFFIMNLFHAVQYFALVWALERSTLQAALSRLRLPNGSVMALALLLCGGGLYGALIEFEPFGDAVFYQVSLVVSIMHFWYDGFVWSAQRHKL